jgi:hypothetical protein
MFRKLLNLISRIVWYFEKRRYHRELAETWERLEEEE